MPMDNRLMIPRRNYDADALRYLNAVQLADGQALEPEIQAAVDAFVKGCKADDIWDAIKASCILCGARTIAGALVPLAGTAPTPYNFAGGDYSRTTGLKGDGSTKYLDTNRANNADPQDDNHLAVYETQEQSGFYTNRYLAGRQDSSSNYTLVGANFYNKSATGASIGEPVPVGLHAVNRSSASEFSYVRASGTPQTIAAASAAVTTVNNILVWTYNGAQFTDARLAFYSIGSSLDLASLDARVSTLVAAIAAAL